MSKVGFKKPPVNRQFGQPEGNAPGKTAKQKQAEMANAEKATLIRGRLLDAVIKATKTGATLEHIEAAMLKLIKDSEDRGLGTPVQSVNVESPNGTMSPIPANADPAKLRAARALLYGDDADTSKD